MTITKSPVSTCGVKTAFSLPRSRLAAFTATFPSTWSWASMTHHLCEISLVLAENVFIGKKSTEITGEATACQPIDRLMRRMPDVTDEPIAEMLAGQVAFARLILWPCRTRPQRPQSRRDATK